MARILLVDDEKNVLRSLSIGLRRHSYSVIQARSGAEAMEKMETHPCEVVISDVRMSPMDGYTLASHIRQRFPWVCMILMSAFGFDEEPLGDFVVQPYPRFTKPFPVSELIRVIEEELAVKSGRKILLVGDLGKVGEIQRVLESVGFLVEVFEPHSDPVNRLRQISYDLFFIDGEVLNDTKWKILNEIDRHDPRRPVFLLAQNHGKRNHLEHPDLAITVVDKKMFYSDQTWVNDLLKNAVNPTSNPA